MRFTVDRSKWRCGGQTGNGRPHGDGETRMLNREGYRCCLGFAAAQLGTPDDVMLGTATPAACMDAGPLVELRCDTKFNSILSKRAFGLNDNDALSREDREQRLTVLFAEHGHELVFEGSYEN